MIQTLQQYIAKALGEYCDEERIKEVLRRRLTKKEYKVLMQQVQQTPPLGELKAKLGLDDTGYARRLESLKKKLNSDTLKRDIFC